MQIDRPPDACPICLAKGARLTPDLLSDSVWLVCPNCESHRLTCSAAAELEKRPLDAGYRARLAHAVFKCKPDAVISSGDIAQLVEATKLPAAAECIDNLLLLMARIAHPGEARKLAAIEVQAAIGAVSSDAALWVLQEAIRAGLVMVGTFDHETTEDAELRRSFRMTASGWARNDALMRAGNGSRHAFMAMDFKQADIQTLFAQHLVPAVTRTDFELRTTQHAAKTAGLIDSRMRVELHTSRFVVCDLTHNNRGAYWEAGFAEGIGRPVFYLCREDVHASKDPEIKPHFDIAHQAIVKWNPADPGPAVEELVAMIRATLPGEARMED